jgi:hypothetical protein
MGMTTFGAHSFSLFGAVRGASQRENDVASSRLTWYWRLP